jgi:hypothetical protein
VVTNSMELDCGIGELDPSDPPARLAEDRQW